MGFCVLRISPEKPGRVDDFAGLHGSPVREEKNNELAGALFSATKQRKTSRVAAHKKGGKDMPGGDGTGPAGMGQMTGRAAGYCAGYPVPGFMNPIPGRGFGFGRGRGSGWGRGYGFGRGLGLGFRGGRGWAGYWGAPYAAPAYPYAGAMPPYTAPYTAPYGAGPTPEQEADMLKGQAEYFEDALEGIRKRIAELDNAVKEKK